MRHDTVRVNGIDLHVRSTGDPQAPLMLFLHGFPEYSGAWDEVLPAFAGDFHAVAPDQRGYARSSKPEGARGLPRQAPGARYPGARRASIRRAGHSCWSAHDWGASVAYATAIAAPNRVARLVVINGVHPGPFQRALIEDEAQRKASAYIHYLRAPQAEARLSANNFEKLLGMLTPLRPAALAHGRQAARLPGGLAPAGRAHGHAQLVPRHAHRRAEGGRGGGRDQRPQARSGAAAGAHAASRDLGHGRPGAAARHARHAGRLLR